MLKVVSLDVVGTLVDFGYEDYVWKAAIPRLLARKRDMSFEAAKDYVLREYDRIGKNDVRWFLPDYWFKHLDLDESPMFVFKSHIDKVRLYPEVPSVLENLSREFDLIIASGTTREIIEIMIQKLRHHFRQIYSPVSDAHETKKTPQFYEMICKNLGVEPWTMVHVGDEWYSDFVSPGSIGINSFYLDRTGKESGESVVKDLRELQGRIAIHKRRE